MIKEINEVDRKSYFINLFNVNYDAKKEDISLYYKDIDIKDIQSAKPGNFDIELQSREEAINIVERGSGVNYRFFFNILRSNFYI